jgi:putative spermidine/putrescine transport system substrate-binding protein
MLRHRFQEYRSLSLQIFSWTFVIALLIGILVSCGKPAAERDVGAMTWPDIESAAKGQTVTLMMWQGDPYINEYMKTYVVPEVKRRYGVELQILSGQGNGLVSQLSTEIEAGKKESAIDMMWINGETFYNLRQIKALHGPFVATLPNAQYLDTANPFINQDFQQKTGGYECPWGNVQMAIIYDSARTSNPPTTRAALAAWVKAHPGRFTFDNAFTGMTFLKALLIDIAGDGRIEENKKALQGSFNQAMYDKYTPQLWAYLNELKPYLWKQGRTFPAGVAEMHQLFANGEIDFTMSNNDGEVDNKVLQGLLPRTARAFVLDGGTIQNSHYMGITKHSAHKAGAMVIINFLISPEAQYRKAQPSIWGDGTVLALERLPAEWRTKFEHIPERQFSPRRADIQPKALQELAPEYMKRVFEDFRKNVIEVK